MSDKNPFLATSFTNAFSLDMKADIDDDEILQLAFSGIAIALAHDGKTRQELASELTHLEEANSEKNQDETEVESTLVEKGAPLIKLKSPNFYVSPTAFYKYFLMFFIQR